MHNTAFNFYSFKLFNFYIDRWWTAILCFVLFSFHAISMAVVIFLAYCEPVLLQVVSGKFTEFGPGSELFTGSRSSHFCQEGTTMLFGKGKQWTQTGEIVCHQAYCGGKTFKTSLIRASVEFLHIYSVIASRWPLGFFSTIVHQEYLREQIEVSMAVFYPDVCV